MHLCWSPLVSSAAKAPLGRETTFSATCCTRSQEADWFQDADIIQNHFMGNLSLSASSLQNREGGDMLDRTRRAASDTPPSCGPENTLAVTCVGAERCRTSR